MSTDDPTSASTDPRVDAGAAPAVDPAELAAFWEVARVKARLNRFEIYTGANAAGSLMPPAWAFGSTPEQADALLALVLDGTKTGTASALWDIEATGESMPEVGALGIVLDGAAHPRALVRTTSVTTVPFSEVTAEHAYAEGESDRTLASWRRIHAWYFRTFAAHERGFEPDMPVVCERFTLLYPSRCYA